MPILSILDRLRNLAHLKNVKIMTLTIGEYYVSNGSGNIFRWGGFDSDYYFSGNKPYHNTIFDTGGGLFNSGDYRLATLEEKQWLHVCVLCNKFIPKEKAIKLVEIKRQLDEILV